MGIATKTVSWFSAGVSSAVATKLMADEIDHIIYCHIDDQHEDTMRFVKDCEAWFGKPVEIIQHRLKTVEEACMSIGFVNSPQGAGCTKILKRRLRKQWEAQNRFFCYLRYVWGMDCDEGDRAHDLVQDMPQDDHRFPLIERGISKAEAHAILKRAGIRRPAMYDLGYPNNNCVGCVKGGMGYWNKIRIDFPDVFDARAKMERRIGATCLRNRTFDKDKPISETNTAKLYLDELDPKAGRDCKIVVPDCGMMCQAIDREESFKRRA